jgi:hypothetical protein
VFQIQGDAALGRVVVPEGEAALRVRRVIQKGPNAARRLAAGRFDLDHVGTEVCHELAAELALFVRQLQNPQAV